MEEKERKLKKTKIWKVLRKDKVKQVFKKLKVTIEGKGAMESAEY